MKAKHIYTDKEFMEQLIGKEEKAWRQFQEMIFPWVEMIAQIHMREELDPREVYQHAVLAFFELLEKGNYKEEGKFVPFFLRICRNYCKNQLRALKKAALTLPEAYENVDNTEEIILHEYREAQKIKQGNDLLEDLNDDEMKLLRLYYKAGKSHKEIAQAMGCTEGFSRLKLHRIMTKLRKKLAEQLEKNEKKDLRGIFLQAWAQAQNYHNQQTEDSSDFFH